LEFENSPEQPRPAHARAKPEHDERHWLRLADENRRQGLHENALRLYSRALELDKSLVAGWVGQVQMLVALGEYPEADLWSRKALEVFRNNGDLLAARAQALCRHGDLKQAVALCDGALAQSGQSAYRWMVRGELMVAGKESVDRHCFDKAVQIDSDWLVVLEIAHVYLHYRSPSKALVRARQAVEKAPDSCYCWYTQARCELDMGLDRRAKESLQRCLELVPGHVEAGQRLAELANRKWSLRRGIRRIFGGS
jgi:tetratricopeptide (TPR) repeat protein